MSVGFTGTQIGMTNIQKGRVKKALDKLSQNHDVFHHGDCIGADSEAHSMAVDSGFSVVLHPPSISTKRAFCKADESRSPMDYLQRNLEIVKESDILLAAPKEKDEQLRSGTWSTIRKARKLGKKIAIFLPDGEVIYEKPRDKE